MTLCLSWDTNVQQDIFQQLQNLICLALPDPLSWLPSVSSADPARRNGEVRIIGYIYLYSIYVAHEYIYS
jgi:hypothetical protein